MAVVWLTAALAVTVLGANDRYGDPLPEGAVQRLGTMRMRYAWTESFRYLPGDRVAVIVPSKNWIDVWDLSAGERLDRYQIGQSRIMFMDARRDGTALLVVNTDGQLIEWNLAEKAEMRRIETGQAKPTVVLYSPDEKRALTAGSYPPSIKEWDLGTGTELVAVTGDNPKFYVSAAIYAPDGKTACVGMGSYSPGVCLSQYDLSTGEKLKEIMTSNRISGLAISPDGERLLVASRYHAHEFRLDGYQKLHQFRGHPGYSVYSVAYGPAEGQILTGDGDGTIRIWDRANEEVLRRYAPHRGRVSGIRVSEDGKRILSFGGGVLVEALAATGKPRLNMDRHLAAVQAAAFTPDGQQVVSGSADGTLRLWEVETGVSLQLMETGSPVQAVAVSPDGARAAAGCKDGAVREYYLASGKLRREIPGHSGYVRDIAYSHAGKYLASSGDDGSVLMRYGSSMDALWPTMRTLRRHRGGVLAVAFSPDDARLLTGGRDRTIRLWDTAAGFGQMHLQTLQEHRDWVVDVAFATGGQQALSADRGGRIILWDLPTGEPVRQMQHGTSITDLVCCPGGTTAWSAADDPPMACWDLTTGEQIAAVGGHAGAVNALALSPDGRLIVSASSDTSLLVWQVPQP